MKCLICDQEFKNRVALCNHLSRKHNLIGQQYYDEYIKGNKICKICGKETKFINIEDGYRIGCCLEHTNLAKFGVKSNLNLEETKKKAQINSHTQEAIQKGLQKRIDLYGGSGFSSEQIKEKIINTNQERYGVDNPWKNENVQNKCKKTKLDKYGDENYNNREKAKETNIEKYGISNPQALDSIKEKTKNTCREKYGTDYYLQTKEFREKSKNSCKSKYGTEIITQSEHFKKKSKETIIKKYNVENVCKLDDIIKRRILTKKLEIEKFEKDKDCTQLCKLIDLYGQGFLTIKDTLTQFTYKSNKFIANSDIQKIINYNNTHTRSRIEDEIYEFVKSIYDGDVIKNTRSIIKPYELDIYIPNKQIAIEYNSNYYHRNVGKNYHLNKTELCLLQDIRLIHIFEWEWFNNREICESLIKSALGIYENKIYARNCIIKEVSYSKSKQFLLENHLQGNVPSSYRLGLYYNDELVQLITMGKSRYKKDEYELLRMCTKLNTQVIGGFSKLIKHQPYNNFISFIDLSKFNGNSYYNIGFDYINVTNPSYTYYKQNKKLNRVSAQKHKLSKLLGDKFDSNKTEIQNMLDAGYYQIYDCGNIKVGYYCK